jgi:hypothetical protein
MPVQGLECASDWVKKPTVDKPRLTVLLNGKDVDDKEVVQREHPGGIKP